jgi:hypothetical protein
MYIKVNKTRHTFLSLKNAFKAQWTLVWLEGVITIEHNFVSKQIIEAQILLRFF